MSRIRHVWVLPEPGPMRPGLLLGWRQGAGQWEALVTYIDASDRAVTDWFSASRLQPVREAEVKPGFAAYGQIL